MFRRREGASWPAAELSWPREVAGAVDHTAAQLGALAGTEVVLELVVEGDRTRWLVRARDEATLEGVVARLRAGYPGCVVERLAVDRPDLDPCCVLGGEEACEVELTPAVEAALPLRGEWHQTLSREEIDPLESVIAAASPGEGERLLCRLEVERAGPSSAGRIRARVPARVAKLPERGRPDSGSATLPLVLLGVATAALAAWQWYQQGEWLALVGLGALALIAPAAGLPVYRRWLRTPPPLLPEVVAEKLGSPLLRARMSVVGVAAEEAGARALALRGAAAYGVFDGAAGGGLRSRKARPLERMQPRTGVAPRRLLLSAQEAAALWHPPVRMAGDSGVGRERARRIRPQPGHASAGVPVGVTDSEPQQVVRQPPALLRRNQFHIAKTRRGKSTLLAHQARGAMAQAASGEERLAVVVVDPHQDLAEAVLAMAPASLVEEERVVYLNFADLKRPLGLNLLDVGLFPDRDRQVEAIVSILRRSWPANWGPRMEAALRVSAATLHVANGRLPRDRQYTLLDIASLLTDTEFLRQALAQVGDPALEMVWHQIYEGVQVPLRQQTASPILTKIGRFSLNEPLRLLFGQSQSTFDPVRLVRDGGVVVINTAVGTLGEGAAGLSGATIVNLFAVLIEQQVELAPEERTRLIMFVDEASTLAAVDYGQMLSELQKYGGSFVLATQSLAKLQSIDPQLVTTIMANIDALTVFQVAAEDAAVLVPELGGGIEIEDLVSLDDFTAYARWWDGSRKPPAFSFRVMPPAERRPEQARAIAEHSAERYGRPHAEVAGELASTFAELLTRRSQERVRGATERSSRGRRGARAERTVAEQTTESTAQGTLFADEEDAGDG